MSNPIPDLGCFLLFAVSLMDLGVPSEHLELVLLRVGQRLGTDCVHIVTVKLYNVLRKSTVILIRAALIIRVEIY